MPLHFLPVKGGRSSSTKLCDVTNQCLCPCVHMFLGPRVSGCLLGLHVPYVSHVYSVHTPVSPCFWDIVFLHPCVFVSPCFHLSFPVSVFPCPSVSLCLHVPVPMFPSVDKSLCLHVPVSLCPLVAVSPFLFTRISVSLCPPGPSSVWL